VVQQDFFESDIEGDSYQRENKAIETLVVYAKNQGSLNADNYYQAIRGLVKKILSITDAQYFSPKEKMILNAKSRRLVEQSIYIGIKAEMPYKMIYRKVKNE